MSATDDPFVDCLRGARPILTAETARHVLDVIVRACASIADGGSDDTGTTIWPNLDRPNAGLAGLRMSRVIRATERPSSGEPCSPAAAARTRRS